MKVKIRSYWTEEGIKGLEPSNEWKNYVNNRELEFDTAEELCEFLQGAIRNVSAVGTYEEVYLTWNPHTDQYWIRFVMSDYY